MENQEIKVNEKGKKGKIIRVIALVAALVAAICSIFVIRSCSAPPKYEEIKGRFEQLVNDSYAVNVVAFGEGLPTYERVNDPKADVKVYNTGEKYTDGDGKEQERKVWYYRTLDEKKIYAFRSSYLRKYSYVFVSDKEMSADSLAALFPAIKDVSAPEGKEFYSLIYTAENKKQFSYLVPYVEHEPEFYYSSDIPDDYDVVRADAKYRTVDEIKGLLQTVYSRNYSLSLHSSLFDGIASGDSVIKARFSESATFGLLQSNVDEDVLFTEKRVYLFDTAEIDRWSSNNEQVSVKIQSYLPSAPDKIVTVTINLVLQDGQWFLDSPTF